METKTNTNEARTVPILLVYQLIPTSKGLTFDVLEQYSGVTFQGPEKDMHKPQNTFTASNGYQVSSKLVVGIRSNHILVQGMRRNKSGANSDFIAFNSTQERDQAEASYVTALNEWAQHHGGIAQRIIAPTGQQLLDQQHAEQSEQLGNMFELLTQALQPSALQLLAQQRGLRRMHSQLMAKSPDQGLNHEKGGKLHNVLRMQADLDMQITQYLEGQPDKEPRFDDKDPVGWMNDALKRMREEVADCARRGLRIDETESEEVIKRNFFNYFVNDQATNAICLALGWKQVRCGVCGGDYACAEPNKGR